MKPITLSAVFALAAVVAAGSVWPQTPSDLPGAVVVIDPADKQNIKGNVSIALAWGEQFAPPQQYLRGFINLREAMVRWTKIDTRIERNLMLGSTRLLQIPFIVVSTDTGFELTPAERKNVKNYLENGGFLFLDNAIPVTEKSPAEASLKQMIRDALGTAARFKPIPNDHALYACFWDFTDGPPIGAEIGRFGSTVTDPRFGSLSRPVHYLEGVWIGERLAVVFSNKGYIVKWAEMENNSPQLKMGVNIVVFSLVQPGGIAKKQ